MTYINQILQNYNQQLPEIGHMTKIDSGGCYFIFRLSAANSQQPKVKNQIVYRNLLNVLFECPVNGVGLNVLRNLLHVWRCITFAIGLN